MKYKSPLACYENIVVQELKDEILVCNLKSNQVYCLNQTAGEVWKLCDGNTEPQEIAQILSRKLRTNFHEELVLFSLDELSKENLLAKKIPAEKMYFGVSRREALKKVGLASMAALPLISSVVMPSAGQAQSGLLCETPLPDGCSCVSSEGCSSGCCQFGTCVPNNAGLCPNDTDCISDAQCDSECCDPIASVCNDASACVPVCPSPPALQPAGCPCNDGTECDSGCCSGPGGTCNLGC